MTHAYEQRIYVFGYYDIPLDRFDEIERAMIENIHLSRQEPGNLRYDFRHDDEIRGRIHMTEEFVDQAALEAHIARVATSPWAEVSKVMKKTFTVRAGKR